MCTLPKLTHYLRVEEARQPDVNGTALTPEPLPKRPSSSSSSPVTPVVDSVRTPIMDSFTLSYPSWKIPVAPDQYDATSAVDSLTG